MRRLKSISHQEEVSVVDHLDELRNRLLVLICLPRRRLRGRLLAVPSGPVFPGCCFPSGAPTRSSRYLLVTGVGEQFAIAVKLSFSGRGDRRAAGALLPAVRVRRARARTRDPQRHMRPLLLLVPSLFIAGVVFCYYLVIPPASSRSCSASPTRTSTPCCRGRRTGSSSASSSPDRPRADLRDAGGGLLMLARLGIVSSVADAPLPAPRDSLITPSSPPLCRGSTR